MNPPPTSILVICPYPIIRDGIVAVLSAALAETNVTASESFPEALALISNTPIDLVITDFRVHGDTVLTFLKKLGNEKHKPRCLILSSRDELHIGYPCIRAGASGFVDRSSPVATVIDATREILAGRHYISPRLSQALFTNGGDGLTTPAGQRLTTREIQIFTHIGEGFAVSMIAAKLGLSIKTIEAHRENIKNKLGYQNAAQVTAAAVRWLDNTSVHI